MSLLHLHICSFSVTVESTTSVDEDVTVQVL